VINTYEVEASEELKQCLVTCFGEKDCISYNLGPVVDNMRKCELNGIDNTTFNSKPANVTDQQGAQYCPFKVRNTFSNRRYIYFPFQRGNI